MYRGIVMKKKTDCFPPIFQGLINLHPYHVDALLQLSELCRLSEDLPMAAELIERALYCLECAFHPSFSLASGNCRLDYRRQENRYDARDVTFVDPRFMDKGNIQACCDKPPSQDVSCAISMVEVYLKEVYIYAFLPPLPGGPPLSIFLECLGMVPPFLPLVKNNGPFKSSHIRDQVSLDHAAFGICCSTLAWRDRENKALFIAVFKHLMFVGARACCRTALEFCKLLLSLEPEGDPLGVLLTIDFYALRAQKYEWLIRLASEWEPSRNLSQVTETPYLLTYRNRDLLGL
ncbi:Transcription factor 25 [Homalodisca vitripennis]|nr:Transcription factor 25 [Homalodisca vitripennis]